MMTKKEYIEANQYLRKGFSNLSDEDLKFFQAVSEGKIDVKNDPGFYMQFKQVFFHMSRGMSLWELRGLYKAIKTLGNLPD